MEADNERLEHECLAYDVQHRDRQERLNVMERMLANNLFPQVGEDDQGDDIKRCVVVCLLD